MKAAIVYQAGIANVFEVESFTNLAARRARRMLQHAFVPCEWYALGLQQAGWQVRTYSCNQVGDITDAPWTEGLEDCPFRDSAHPPADGGVSRFTGAVSCRRRDGTCEAI